MTGNIARIAPCSMKGGVNSINARLIAKTLSVIIIYQIPTTMTNNKITPAWVVENYLPDYEKQIDDYNSEVLKNYPEATQDQIARLDILGPDEVFIDKHFPEALAAFAKSICERQREMCYKASFGKHEADHEAILSAPMPDLTKNR